MVVEFKNAHMVSKAHTGATALKVMIDLYVFENDLMRLAYLTDKELEERMIKFHENFLSDYREQIKEAIKDVLEHDGIEAIAEKYAEATQDILDSFVDG